MAGDRDNLEFTLLVDPPTMSPRSFKLVINNRELASRIASLSTEGQTLIFQMLVAAFTKDQDVSRVDISFRWTPSGGLRTMRAEEGGDCIFLTLL